MKYDYTIHKEEIAYDGFFKFHRYHVSYEKFSGGMIENVVRECGRKGDIVAVLPYDPITKEFLMVEQFRIGMVARNNKPWTLEIVAGFMDVENETAFSTALRELEEETGCIANAMYPLLSYYPGPGGSASKIEVFLAIVDASTASTYTGILEEGEDIRVHRLPLAEMKEKTAQGTLGNATTIIAYQQFFMNNWEKKL